MKACLMFRDRDFETASGLPPGGGDLICDLDLSTLFDVMASGDAFIRDVAQNAVLESLTDTGTILYRQDILKDCIKNASIVGEIYGIALRAIEKEKKEYFYMIKGSPSYVLHRSLEVLKMFTQTLRSLRRIADDAGAFESEGFVRLFAGFREDLSDEFFLDVQKHVKELAFREGMLLSARPGKGVIGSGYALRKPPRKKQKWLSRVFSKKTGYSYYVRENDEAGMDGLYALKDRGFNIVANTIAQSNDHILSFLNVLRRELAFYIGCVNLHGELAKLEEPCAYPLLFESYERRHVFCGLYDPCLALRLRQKVAGNDVCADEKELVVITGANQGGKSAFLRSIGLSQLMAQCGMFVSAENFSANICENVFTHFKRGEDTQMKSGKLDEELFRMDGIVKMLKPNSLLLFNKSFSATNEREGSEIARQIVRALIEKHIKVFFVTHLYDFAQSFYEKNMQNAVFLYAERKDDGTRTYKLTEGGPFSSNFGEDLYAQVFEAGNRL
jgi:DNA mismatch repair ATPase MutS